MNEFDFIRALREEVHSRARSSRIVAGIGDDASVIRELGNRDLVMTTDLLIENVDFYRDATPAALLGHKALAVSLSDIAAMGARPLWSLLSFGFPQGVWNSSFKEKFLEGYLDLADRYGVTLTGGDVSESKNGIVIDSILIGEITSGAAIKRAGAQLGDQIYVTGNLGGAAAGLKLIEMGARLPGTDAQLAGSADVPSASSATDEAAIQSLLLRQLQPSPRVGWGIVLGEQQLASAMIDLSDGLSSDLHHLCEASKVGALIDSASLPLNEDVKQLCGRRALDPLALALHGGEDFELLFTVRPEAAARLPKKVDGVAICRIGEITAACGTIMIQELTRIWELKPGGFSHF